jgi:hypothetical protein
VVTRRSHVTDGVPDDPVKRLKLWSRDMRLSRVKEGEAVSAQAECRSQPPFQPSPRRVRGPSGDVIGAA